MAHDTVYLNTKRKRKTTTKKRTKTKTEGNIFGKQGVHGYQILHSVQSTGQLYVGQWSTRTEKTLISRTEF